MSVLASPFEQDNVAPGAFELADSLAAADSAKTLCFVQLDAGLVLREDARLQGPNPVLLGLLNESAQQFAPDPFASSRRSHVDRDLSNSSIDKALGNRAQRCPSE